MSSFCLLRARRLSTQTITQIMPFWHSTDDYVILKEHDGSRYRPPFGCFPSPTFTTPRQPSTLALCKMGYSWSLLWTPILWITFLFWVSSPIQHSPRETPLHLSPICFVTAPRRVWTGVNSILKLDSAGSGGALFRVSIKSPLSLRGALESWLEMAWNVVIWITGCLQLLHARRPEPYAIGW